MYRKLYLPAIMNIYLNSVLGTRKAMQLSIFFYRLESDTKTKKEVRNMLIYVKFFS